MSVILLSVRTTGDFAVISDKGELNMENKRTKGIRFMVELSLMSAIILVMAMTPLGYVRTPALSITLLTIPVAVGAIILGPKGGAILGAVFGATSFAQAVSGGGGMTAILFQTNPLGTTFLCFVPRILEGFLCGLIFQMIRKTNLKKASYYIAGLSCPIINTVLFMGTLVVLFYQTEYIQKLVSSLGATNPLVFIVALVGIQGVIEALVCGILSGTVSLALSRALKR